MRSTLITNRARAMRKAMTEPEVMLWSRLRGRGSDKPTFRRQHPFGSIILDFYCPAARLAVEVDGSTHWDEAARRKDEARDHWLMGQGISVLRIPAAQVWQDLGAPYLPRPAAGGGPSAERSEERMVEGASGRRAMRRAVITSLA